MTSKHSVAPVIDAHVGRRIRLQLVSMARVLRLGVRDLFP